LDALPALMHYEVPEVTVSTYEPSSIHSVTIKSVC